MPPKPASDPSVDALVALFQSIGLPKPKAQEATKSPKSAAILKELVDTFPVLSTSGLDEKQATLVGATAIAISKSSGVGKDEREYVITQIIAGDLKTVDQVNGKLVLFHSLSRILIHLKAAVKYTETHRTPINETEFNENCGVGGYSIYKAISIPFHGTFRIQYNTRTVVSKDSIVYR